MFLTITVSVSILMVSSTLEPTLDYTAHNYTFLDKLHNILLPSERMIDADHQRNMHVVVLVSVSLHCFPMTVCKDADYACCYFCFYTFFGTLFLQVYFSSLFFFCEHAFVVWNFVNGFNNFCVIKLLLNYYNNYFIRNKKKCNLM